MWQHIGKREIAFCTIIEFFNVQAFDPSPLTSKEHFLSPISNFESLLKKGRVKLTPKNKNLQKFISQPSINHPGGA